jgi:uncharacterized phiE125 gp8 family phage protein
MLSIDPLGLDSVMLDEARAYLRVEAAEEDASLSAIILAAIGYAERFTGQITLRREAREILTAGSPWQTLSAFPVTSVTGVTGIPAEGASFALDPSAYEAKIGSRGEAHLRVLQPGSAGRVEVAYQAGIAADWAALPEVMRLAVLRLAGYLHANRDGAEDKGPPAAVAALLLPWRRMRLS